MKCRKCSGRVFLDRVFSDNANYEVYCVMCGDRRFISKSSELGQWLSKKETARQAAGVLDR
jgi:DNA-directed RNA polymerase subunit RPC12/RpoP